MVRVHSSISVRVGFRGNPVGNKYFALTDALGPKPPDPLSKSRIEIERQKVPDLVPPPIVLPHGKMGNSPAGIECDETGGKFGPFANQLFVSEQTHSKIHRVFLEKVNGFYQGAAFPFVKGFGSGNIVARFATDGSMFTGGTNRGWGSHGKNPFSFQRVNWTGKVPFEVHEMRVKPDGFELTFTKAADSKSLSDLSSYAMESYTYVYQKGYGSPVVDKSVPVIKKAVPAKDGKSVRLIVEGMVKGNVHELKMPGIRLKGDHPPSPSGLLYPQRDSEKLRPKKALFRSPVPTSTRPSTVQSPAMGNRLARRTTGFPCQGSSIPNPIR